MPTDRDTGKRRETTLLERVRIIELNAQGFSLRAIAHQTKISKSTVHRLLQQWTSTWQLEPVSRSGRPEILNIRDKRRLYRLSDANPYASLAELTAESGLNISPGTAGRILRGSGRRVRYACNKPVRLRG